MNVVSFGGGTNSAAMIIGMHERKIPIDLILFADPGAEQPHTYDFIATFDKWLAAHDLPEIIPVWRNDKYGNRLTLERECLESHSLPSIAYGFKKCSLKHKIGPQEKYCNNEPRCREAWAAGDKVHKFIGYDAGETRRVEHAAAIDAIDKKYIKHYPLFEWGWSREACQAAIEAAGLPLPGKSSCFYCPSMKKAEIVDLYKRHPDLFERAVALEHNAAETLKTTKGLGRKWSWESFIETYLKTEEWNEAQLSLFPDSPGGCICGAPCGCYDGTVK